MTIECRCGWRVEGVDDKVRAEVIADRHESSDVRRPHRHETSIIAETFWTNYNAR